LFAAADGKQFLLRDINTSFGILHKCGLLGLFQFSIVSMNMLTVRNHQRVGKAHVLLKSEGLGNTNISFIGIFSPTVSLIVFNLQKNK